MSQHINRRFTTRELLLLAAAGTGKLARIKQPNGTYTFLDGKTPGQRKTERRKEKCK